MLKFNTAEKLPKKPKRKPDRLPTTIFKGRAVQLGGGGVRWNKWYYLMLTIFPSDTLGSFPPKPCKY